jgi:hypothetical protein
MRRRKFITLVGAALVRRRFERFSWSIDRECPRREKDDCNRYGVADQERCHRLVSI